MHSYFVDHLASKPSQRTYDKILDNLLCAEQVAIAMHEELLALDDPHTDPEVILAFVNGIREFSAEISSRAMLAERRGIDGAVRKKVRESMQLAKTEAEAAEAAEDTDG